MSIYRQIYEQSFGPIPKGHHIHHIDGNHSNNNIENLQCVSAQEHYNIHFAQGDWAACILLSKNSFHNKSELATLSNNKRLSEGTHPFLDSKWQSEMSIRTQKKRVESGTHHFQHQPKVQCPHCGKIGGNGIMHRYHFDRCKSKSS